MGETACRVQCPPPSPLSPAPPDLTLRHAGLQRQRVKYSAHLALQRLIDDLVLLDAGFAAERLRDHGRRIVVAIAGQIADRHLGVGYSRLDHRFDIAGVHRHPSISPIRRFESRPAFGPRLCPNLARLPFYVTPCRTIFAIQSLQSRWIIPTRSHG